MRKPPPIEEIFAHINTAHLAALMNEGNEEPGSIRKWLANYRPEMSEASKSFFNDLNVSKKSFSLALKKYFQQYQKRRSFITTHDGKDTGHWISAFGATWEETGGVYDTDKTEDRKLTPEELKRAAKKGIVTYIDEKEPGVFDAVLELVVKDRESLNRIISLLDQCGLPIVTMQNGKSETLVTMAIGCPNSSELNQVIKNNELPAYAKQYL